MDTFDTQTWIALAIVGVLAVLAIAGWIMYRRKQTYRLERRFGHEYERTVDVLGSRSKAEAELKAREERVAHLEIVPLSPADAQRFRRDWDAVQARFVDDPRSALVDADRLVGELMVHRGYPMGEFERRAADISVDHPAVVEHYRIGHAVALRADRGEADTESLRKAVVHYRALFDELLEVRADGHAAARQPMEIRS
jgi:hypothetical protein